MDENIKEIDLLKVVAYIFHRKLFIIISFFLSLCLGLIYINTLTKEKLVYLNIDVLQSNELYEYSLINFLSTEFNAPSTKFNAPDEDTLGIDFMLINSENLGLLAQTTFHDRLVKNDILKSSNYFNNLLNDDIQFGNVSSNFLLLEPVLNKAAVDLSGRQLTPYYQLRFKTSLGLDNQNYKDLFLYVLNEIESRVKDRINNMYQRNIKILSIRNSFELDELKNKKNNLIDDYIIDRKARLLYLEENLSIAKAIEQDPENKKSPYLDNAKVNIYESAGDPFPYYFYGSTAIMQEILEVKKDMDVINPSVAIEGILAIDSEIRNINQNNAAEEINIALDVSPLGKNNKFKIFTYDIDNLKSTNVGNSHYLIMFFFGLVGIFFGFLLIFISYLRKEIKDLS